MDVRPSVTSPPITCPADAPIANVARLMLEHDIGFVVVVDDERHPVGVVTDRDLAIRVLTSHRSGTTQVGDVMSKDVISVREDRSLIDTARQMALRKCRRLPVVDDEDRVVGVMALDDLLRDSIDVIEEAAQAVRGHGPEGMRVIRNTLGKVYLGRTTITG